MSPTWILIPFPLFSKYYPVQQSKGFIYFLLHTVAHVCMGFSSWMSKCNLLPIGKSKRFLGFDTRFCISSMTGSCLLQSCSEASTEIGRPIPDSKGLQIKCSNQTTSSCSNYSCLKSHGKAVNTRTRALPHISSTTVTHLARRGMMLLTGNCFQLRVCFQNNTTLKKKKKEKTVTVYPG